MDNENMALEDKCENLMNIVVESRKRFGKMCIDYEQKTSLMENKILNLQLETIANLRFKSKHNLPDVDIEAMYKDIAEWNVEVMERTKKIEDLSTTIQNTQKVILQLKNDQTGQKLRRPLTAKAMCVSAKNKNCC